MAWGPHIKMRVSSAGGGRWARIMASSTWPSLKYHPRTKIHRECRQKVQNKALNQRVGSGAFSMSILNKTCHVITGTCSTNNNKHLSKFNIYPTFCPQYLLTLKYISNLTFANTTTSLSQSDKIRNAATIWCRIRCWKTHSIHLKYKRGYLTSSITPVRGTWRHQAITWTNDDLSTEGPMKFIWELCHNRYFGHQSLRFTWKFLIKYFI